MCYSAQIKADYQRFVREYGAVLSIKDFFDLFWRRLADPRIQVPRAWSRPLHRRRLTKVGRSSQ